MVKIEKCKAWHVKTSHGDVITIATTRNAAIRNTRKLFRDSGYNLDDMSFYASDHIDLKPNETMGIS